jgi:hypothetical protein
MLLFLRKNISVIFFIFCYPQQKINLLNMILMTEFGIDWSKKFVIGPQNRGELYVITGGVLQVGLKTTGK